jgi:hypothetical protein
MARPFLVATFADEAPLVHAVRTLRAHGFRIWDVYTPYPVHGLAEALGLRRSRLPWVAAGAGLVGLIAALGFQLYAAGLDWPVNVGGKPDTSVLPFIPVTFEITILAAGLATVAALLVRCRLLPGPPPRLAEPGTTDTVFALALRRRDGGFDAGMARRLLEESGARTVGERALDL